MFQLSFFLNIESRRRTRTASQTSQLSMLRKATKTKNPWPLPTRHFIAPDIASRNAKVQQIYQRKHARRNGVIKRSLYLHENYNERAGTL
ncbi:hypothetical protein E2C01_000042 [Portunus trituberculatus]|uniref:Uncharacterized protein n=1 Tax=Portunus trituberculatus TaxID=210409 RepID=A0A5B7CE33_PORTR|nr:hypothetical protein [Portunus trituberculatus]